MVLAILLPSKGRSQRIFSYSLILIVTSLFFLIWAIYNTATEHYFDVGLICFPLTIATGVYALLILSSKVSPQLLYLQRTVIGSYVITVLAYVMSLCTNPLTRVTYASYCIIASFLWGINGLYFHYEVTKYSQETSEGTLLSTDRAAGLPHDLG
jgi:hypothetical protein